MTVCLSVHIVCVFYMWCLFFFFLAKIGLAVYVWHCVYVFALWFAHKVQQLDVAVSLSRGCCHGSSRVCLFLSVCVCYVSGLD